MRRPYLRRWALNAALALPTPVLRALSGGAATHRQGRTLEPRLQFIGAALKRYPAIPALPPQEARRLIDEEVAIVQGRLPRGVRTEALSVPGQAGPRPARLYRPAAQDPRAPVMVYAHQGGGVLGGLDTDDAFCGLLAQEARCPVLSVDYRLAPEHRFPAGLEDVLAAYRWARDGAGRFGAPAGRAMLGGASMGGGFAAAICHRLKAEGEAQPDLQLLVYPAVDLASEAPSVKLFGDGYALSSAMMEWFLAQYVGPDLDPADPRLSPLREASLEGLAPAVIGLAGFDPLADEGEAYARRLLAEGGRATLRRYDSLCHGFTALTGAVPAAEAACREVAGLVRARIEASAESALS